jgi:hypothetical protein
MGIVAIIYCHVNFNPHKKLNTFFTQHLLSAFINSRMYLELTYNMRSITILSKIHKNSILGWCIYINRGHSLKFTKTYRRLMCGNYSITKYL